MPRAPVLHVPSTVNLHATLSPGSCERMVIDSIPAIGRDRWASETVTIVWIVRVMNLRVSVFGRASGLGVGVSGRLRVGALVRAFFFGVAMRHFSSGNGDQVTEWYSAADPAT